MTTSIPKLPDVNEVHIWHASLVISEQQEKFFYSSLSKDEIQRADRFHFFIHRRRFIVARGILRSLLSDYLHVQPNEIEFHYTENKKPYLNNSLLKFNISHSDDLAVFAFTSHHEIGVDIEKIAPTFKEGVAERYFSDKEYKELMTLPPSQQIEAFYRIWSRKEAVIKALGKGLYFSLKSFSVSLNKEIQILNLENAEWHLESFNIHPEFQSAFCTQQSIKKTSYFNWNRL